jgi:hypothetical protein
MGFLGKRFGRSGGDPPLLKREIEKAMNGLAAATSAHGATWQMFGQVRHATQSGMGS